MRDKENSYVNEIIESLKILGGAASLMEIQNDIEQRNTMPFIHSNVNWKDNVRATIQRHCSTTKSYRGAEDIFYSVYGLGEGYWGLNSYRTKVKLAEVNPIEQRILTTINTNTELSTTEKSTLVLARRGQGLFRDRLLEKYKKCIVTGIDDKRLLIASHIKPWRNANNMERLSVDNGLLLSVLFDKMFDLGLITFQKNGKLVVSSAVTNNTKSKLYIDYDKVYIVSPSDELKRNLEYHNDVIFIR